MSETTTKRTIVKRVRNGALFSDGTIRIDRVRASYPHIGKPYEGKNDDGNITASYGCMGLLPKNDYYKEVVGLCFQRIKELMKENHIDKLAADRMFLKDGDLMAKDETEGMWVVSSRESNPPAIRGPKIDPKTGKAQRLTPEQAVGIFYGGCYVTLLIRPWAQNHRLYGKRINANLVAIQFVEDGVPFGEGRISDDSVDDSFEADEADDTGGFTDTDDDL